ncbi:hypothetical protein ZYGR_0P00210 [Zygosaccharomyces rouxii]|nr:hypothetical protein ZYGR_0P00210 [Zygosaccharomyces rouxii]
MSSGTDRQKESDDMSGDKNQNLYDKSNGNHEMLSFNDNYAMILQKLANDNSHLLTQDLNLNSMGVGPSTSDNNNDNSNNSNNGNSANFPSTRPSDIGNSGNGGDRQNLDALLQHYQSLLTRSASQYPESSAGASVGENNNNINNRNNCSNNTVENNVSGNSVKNSEADTSGKVDSNNNTSTNNNNNGNNNSHNTTTSNNAHNSNNKSMITERPCDHCRRRQTKCVLVPDLADCVQCETKGIKCTFSDLPNNVNKFMGVADTMNPNGKHQRQDNGVDLEGLLKRAKINNNDNVAQYYAELLQNLHESMNNNNNNNNNGSSSIHASAASSAPTPTTMHNNGFVNMLQQGQQQQQPPVSLPPQQQPPPFPSQPSGQYPRSSLYVGPTSSYDLNLINHIKLDNIDQI